MRATISKAANAVTKTHGLLMEWRALKLKDVCELVNGRAYSQEELLSSGKYKVLRVGNFFTNNHWYYSDMELEPRKYCDDGDLLYAWSASFGPRIWQGGKVIFHYHIWNVLHDASVINQKFLFRYFQWDKELIKQEHGTGTTMIHVSKGTMEQRAILVPPLPTQHRIVARLDTLQARSRAAKDELSRIPKLVERYKQAVLSAAFRGELTAGWRLSNRTKMDSVSILEEARLRVGSQKRKSAQITRSLVSDEVPSGWMTSRLEDVCLQIVDGAHHTPEYVSTGVPFISVKDIREERISFDDCKFITEASHLELSRRCRPQQGDILITKSGTIGRCAIVDREREFSLFVSVALIRLATEKILPEYIKYLLEYWIGSIDIASDIVGSTVKNLHLQDIKALSAPIPSTAEQEEIIRQVKQAFASIEKTRSEATRATAFIDRLDQAILAKAFSGGLVSD